MNENERKMQTKQKNGKVQIAIGPLAMTPAGFTVPQSAFGKKI